MRIIVPIKQVPQSSDVKMDPVTGTMIRSGSVSVLNPLDLYAIETALRLKEEWNATVTVITMGPAGANRILKEALSMGCDEAVHLSAREFSGSDTYATSYILSKAIRKIGDVDLIITGERATDGDTAQVGPGIAAWLDIPVVSYVASVDITSPSEFTAERLIEEGYQQVQGTLPALLTVVKEIAEVRLPTLRGKKRSMNTTIPVWSVAEVDPDPLKIGLKGSPTRVVKIETPKVSRSCRTLVIGEELSTEVAVSELIEFLEARNLLGQEV